MECSLQDLERCPRAFQTTLGRQAVLLRLSQRLPGLDARCRVLVTRRKPCANLNDTNAPPIPPDGTHTLRHQNRHHQVPFLLRHSTTLVSPLQRRHRPRRSFLLVQGQRSSLVALKFFRTCSVTLVLSPTRYSSTALGTDRGLWLLHRHQRISLMRGIVRNVGESRGAEKVGSDVLDSSS